MNRAASLGMELIIIYVVVAVAFGCNPEVMLAVSLSARDQPQAFNGSGLMPIGGPELAKKETCGSHHKWTATASARGRSGTERHTA